MHSSLKILALDTATRCCSVALQVGGQLVAEQVAVSERTHSVHLVDMIRATLKMANVRLPAVDGFAVTIGPGSFTGLRIGISTIEGLAFAAGKPCVGISSLEALASACLPWPHAIYALMDARKGEVYAGLYCERSGGLERLEAECVLPVEAALQAVDGPHLFVGDGAVRYQERIRSILGSLACFAPPERNLPRAATVARLAGPLLVMEPGFDPKRLVPRYLRQSDAELHIRCSTGQSGRV